MGTRWPKRRHLNINEKIVFFVFILLAAVLFTAGLFVERILVSTMEERLKHNALDIAYAVSQIPEIRKNVGKSGGETEIQPVAEAIRQTTSADFIVVIDMESIRYSHPTAENIGRKFVGGDEGRVLQGEIYTSKATGTLGPSLRGFVPVYNGEEQVGAVSVGIMIDDIAQMLQNTRYWLFLSALASLSVGLIGSGYLAQNIKKAMHGLEPHEISGLLHEREAILQSVREGLLAVDAQGKIILINNEARRILGIDSDVAGRDIDHYFPGDKIGQILQDGSSLYNEELSINNIRVLSNIVPIVGGSGIIKGAIISFRDMTEILSMAEELTGVMKFVETVRVQNHEFSNKLHTISGLIQLGENKRAVEFISELASSHHQMISFVSERIKDPAVAAVLLGKTGKARELAIDLRINPESVLGDVKKTLASTLVTIIGNLLDNAMEAVLEQVEEQRIIEFAVYDEFGSITISISDTGSGMPADIQERVFEKGFTTRRGDNRGLGLYIVKSLLDTVNGEIAIESSGKDGTELSVFIPNRG